MEDDELIRLSRTENFAWLGRLFPQGPAGNDVLAELAPEGWEKCELVAVAHPSPERLLEEAIRLHRNIESFPWRKKDEPPTAPPTMDEIMEDYKRTPADATAECANIVGRCLWDIFSDNNDVIAPDGRVMDLGSFRGAGGTIAEWLNETLHGERYGPYDYMDFYMGTVWVSGRADLSPVYRMIFRRLLNFGFDWRFSYPGLGVVRFGKPDKPAGEAYDPSKAFEEEQEEARKQREFEEMQEDLRESYNESVGESRKLPPPETVKAYMSIYGKAPQGWPPVPDEGGDSD